MSNSNVYLVAAYVGTALLYGLYYAWLLRTERGLERRTSDTSR